MIRQEQLKSLAARARAGNRRPHLRRRLRCQLGLLDVRGAAVLGAEDVDRAPIYPSVIQL